jgi:hypothetical protein
MCARLQNKMFRASLFVSAKTSKQTRRDDFTPAIPALGRLRQENIKFETSLGYTVRLS